MFHHQKCTSSYCITPKINNSNSMNREQKEQQLHEQYPTAVWVDDGKFDINQVRTPNQAGSVAPTIVRKPWGFEIWLVFTERYALKILIVMTGYRFSLQRHEHKEE